MTSSALLDRVLGSHAIPASALRLGIRTLLRRRLRDERRGDMRARRARLVDEMRASPIAVASTAANAQHYEVPTAFYQQVLGRQLKYSSGYWPEGVATLDGAEEAMLALTAERAGLRNGQRILDLGCGWGSLTLWVAVRFPSAHLTAVTISRTQKAHIDAEARRRGLANVEVVVADAAAFESAERFDRIVTIEMLEHLRNWEAMLGRIAGWLAPGGRVFVHVFANRRSAYAFDDEGGSDWMARHFFTGGLMPSDDLICEFQHDLHVLEQWRVSGVHYARTCEAWLTHLEHRRAEIVSILAETYGAEAGRRVAYWRVFFLACAELFAYAGGEEWGVCHTLMGI